jgi:hypothetical protein
VREKKEGERERRKRAKQRNREGEREKKEGETKKQRERERERERKEREPSSRAQENLEGVQRLSNERTIEGEHDVFLEQDLRVYLMLKNIRFVDGFDCHRVTAQLLPTQKHLCISYHTHIPTYIYTHTHTHQHSERASESMQVRGECTLQGKLTSTCEMAPTPRTVPSSKWSKETDGWKGGKRSREAEK